MSIISRAALKAQFKSGAVPTSNDFVNLIDSTLVKRDDAFFGKWVAGTNYFAGDVVIYEKAFYILKPDNTADCGCGPGKEKSEYDETTGYCSKTPPKQDESLWEMLDIDAADEDWEIVKNGDEPPQIMYAKVFGSIGMGTQTPNARVHIQVDELNAGFLFSPVTASAPEFVIQQTGESEQHVSESIADNKINFNTNTNGYQFVSNIVPPPAEEGGEYKVAAANEKPVFITNDAEAAKIGIGHNEPLAALDILNKDAARTLLNPAQADFPQVVMLSKNENNTQQYGIVRTDADSFSVITNAPKGFFIKKGTDKGDKALENINALATETQVVVTGKGRVGVGTDEPVTNVEINKPGGAGSFRMCLDKPNPALAILNNRPSGDKQNYFTLGADNDRSILITDAVNGFVFKKGDEFKKEKDNDLNINHGVPIFTIAADGRTVIGGVAPHGYELCVKGQTRSYGHYIDTDENSINNVTPLDTVLDRVLKLNPVSFNFKANTNCLTGEQQIGFVSHEVEEHFPDLIRTDSDSIRTMAYANMVAVLTKAIQEQQSQIDNLVKRIEALEGK
ncbi:endosialidase-like protein [Chitinophaga skermanii]|uniref:Endosialidase-like protein n=1 Tax=Chitinophaga skermanii TaxID=331697 RepID=A0A327QPF9_9BACT|nr:tail fiber domain-containing protein [Chitinophaga skermanii]RAJ06516.1 endosialidase-like protein [Chitinophaga skermanii]